MSTDTMGKRTKPMVDGMYTRHPQYREARLSSEELHRLQNEQSHRCRQKAITRDNARKILTDRLV
jgi:hypothetical protein